MLDLAAGAGTMPTTGRKGFDMAKALITWGGWDGHEPDKVAAIFAAILRDAGADFIAVISGVFDAPDPSAALAAYNRSFSKGIP